MDAVGQGRVWTGSDAMVIHLVDEIGGLDDAVSYAAVAAGDPDMSNWSVTGYPKPMSQMEELLEMFGSGVVSASVQEGLTGKAEALTEKLEDLSRPVVLARMDAEIEIR